jgi:hypothetical protein
MAVNPHPLPRLEHHLIHSERRNSKGTAQRHETLCALRINPSPARRRIHTRMLARAPDARRLGSERAGADLGQVACCSAAEIEGITPFSTHSAAA